MIKANKPLIIKNLKLCDTDRVRTYNPQIRSLKLYPVELRCLKADAKIRLYFICAIPKEKKSWKSSGSVGARSDIRRERNPVETHIPYRPRIFTPSLAADFRGIFFRGFSRMLWPQMFADSFSRIFADAFGPFFTKMIGIFAPIQKNNSYTPYSTVHQL